MSASSVFQYTLILGTCLMSLMITAQEENATEEDPSPWSVRLVGGTYESEGRVEVFINNQWGTICDSLWGIEEANVVCRTLNYSGADLALVAGQYGGGQGAILLDNMECTGSERNISACKHSDQVDGTRCSHSRDAAVVCTSQGSLRLADGTVPGEGRVEILGASEEWGTICDDSWGTADASVACRQLGFPDALEALVNEVGRDTPPVFGPGTGPILLDGLTCEGTEQHLRDCGVTKEWGVHDCTHNEDAGMKCETKMIRLVDGMFGDEGRVELYYGGHWGRICPTNWTMEDANVACRELGYPLGARSTKMFAGAPPFLLDDLRCEGNESRLADCESLGWANNRNCEDDHDVAGVVCNDPLDIVQLLSGSSTLEGVVEYRFESEPGLICDPDWSGKEAGVLCRQLGFQEGRRSNPVSLGPLSGTIHYHDYQCNGTENQLEDCPYTKQSSRGTQCKPEDIAQVVCGPPRDFDLRMTGSSFSEQGALEVFLQDQWGYVADGYFSYADRDAVCRHLGYATGTSSFSQRHDHFDYDASRPILIDNLSCNDDDRRITDCDGLELTGPNSTRDQDNVKSVTCIPFESVANHPVRFRDENGVINNDYGVIEIYHDGVWGVICDSYFSSYRTLCRELGHTDITDAGHLSNYDNKFKSNARMWFSLSYCSSSHDKIYQCRHGHWGDTADCPRDSIATAKCVYVDRSLDYNYNNDETPSWSGSGLGGWEIVLIIIAIFVPMGCIVGCCFRSRRTQTITVNGNAPAAGASYTAATNTSHIEGGSTDSAPPYVPPSPTPDEMPPTYDSVTKPAAKENAATNYADNGPTV